MNESLMNKVNKLKEEILTSDDYLLLKKLDENLSENDEVIKLAYAKDMKSLDYEDALKHFKEDSKEVKDAQKALYEAKLALDNHPLVRQYNAQYKKVKEMYDKINEEIFYPFN